MRIIGLDAASQFDKFGFAVGNLKTTSVGVTDVGMFGNDAERHLVRLATLVRIETRLLIAIDAPLGWPEPMGRFLKDHMAGQHLPVSKDAFFKRRTDSFVREIFGKNPLEVGADRIARAAHHALDVLGQLRKLSGKPIPLTWDTNFTGVAAIEVYPAATLLAHGVDARGYKSKEKGHELRAYLAKELRPRIRGIESLKAFASDHTFDACLCVLAGKDFLEGKAAPPSDVELARREGWIWVRSKETYKLP